MQMRRKTNILAVMRRGATLDRRHSNASDNSPRRRVQCNNLIAGLLYRAKVRVLILKLLHD